MTSDTGLRLELWDDRGLALERSTNIPEMKVHLGGVEPDERIVARHERILESHRTGTGRMFLILIPGEPRPVGSVGFWEREWRGAAVAEMGWQILPAFQGRGLAVAATIAAVARLAEERFRPQVHAYPKTTNSASNAVCRKAGFELLGEVDFEFPKGNPIRCNDWRYDLTSAFSPAAGSADDAAHA